MTSFDFLSDKLDSLLWNSNFDLIYEFLAENSEFKLSEDQRKEFLSLIGECSHPNTRFS